MKKFCAAAVLISLFGAAHAAPKSVPFKAIKPLVLNYLQVTGCPDDAIDPKLTTKFSDAANNLNGYIVVANTDASCAGGSGTSGPAIIVVRTAEGQEGIADADLSYLKVDAVLSEPVARSTNESRALTSVYQENGQLYATGLTYGKDDANCCPSVKSLYKIKLVKKNVSVGKDDSRPVFTWEFTPVKK